jgi:hypothetical protein
MSKPDALEELRAARWLLLVHQLPPKPAYQRVKIWRRLRAMGAVIVKNSVYVLPAGDQTREDFQWLLKEITAGGGEGMICEARLLDGLSDDEVRGLFSAARDTDYDVIAKSARELTETVIGEIGTVALAEARTKLARLEAEAARVSEIDFFGANSRQTVDGLLGALEKRLNGDENVTGHPKEEAGDRSTINALRSRVWVTRRSVYVDRIASAWLIRRFIDTRAAFKFVTAKGYSPEPGELRFDMFDGEFTHEGDCCTFEVLLQRTGLVDPALTGIAEIVHDIDLKDAKFGREEAGGIRRIIDGISAAHADDAQRLERGAAVFDDLYKSFGGKRR